MSTISSLNNQTLKYNFHLFSHDLLSGLDLLEFYVLRRVPNLTLPRYHGQKWRQQSLPRECFSRRKATINQAPASRILWLHNCTWSRSTLSKQKYMQSFDMEFVLYRSVHDVCAASVQFVCYLPKPSCVHCGQSWAWKRKYLCDSLLNVHAIDHNLSFAVRRNMWRAVT